MDNKPKTGMERSHQQNSEGQYSENNQPVELALSDQERDDVITYTIKEAGIKEKNMPQDTTYKREEEEEHF